MVHSIKSQPSINFSSQSAINDLNAASLIERCSSQLALGFGVFSERRASSAMGPASKGTDSATYSLHARSSVFLVEQVFSNRHGSAVLMGFFQMAGFAAR